MIRNKKWLFVLIALVTVVGMVLAACKPKETATPPVTRKGAWVDELVFTSIDDPAAAVAQIQAGQLDIYAYSVADAEVYKTVQADTNLAYSVSYGTTDEITFNVAPCADTKQLNPFSNAKIREAVNWLVDRNYVVQEIFGGLAVPRYLAILNASPDYAEFVDTVRELEAYYAYDPDKAKEVIKAEMEAMGATLGSDGKWQFNGKPITIIFLIRTEDERKEIGTYVGQQLEDAGFVVDFQYKTRSEASPLWVQSDPAECLWHVYTGGWINTAIDRDQGENFAFYYTNRIYPIPLFQAYAPPAELDDIALRLNNNDFTSREERAELFREALRLSAQYATRVWIVDQISFTPRIAKLEVASDLYAQVAGTALYPHTLRFTGQEGGTVRIAQPGILVEPWNPLAGSNWIYDAMPQRGVGDFGVIADPYTGLNWPQRVERAEVVAQQGLPIDSTLDWVTLSFEPAINVPEDAWADWDAENQRFITVGEKFPEGTTAKVKSTVYYPANLFDSKWHDGSNISVGDFVMAMILTFDPGKPESPIYDEAIAETVDTYLSHFKGVRIVSTNPLVIETYDDLYQLDAELNVASWWPQYGYGEGAWHTMALGYQATSAGELAWSTDKAEADGVEWMSFVAGPSLEILKRYLDQNVATPVVPYEATLSQYVTAEEAQARYNNLKAFYDKYGHFWVNSGPFILTGVYPVEGTLKLTRNPDYPFMADKWAGFGEAKIAEVDVEGPSQVKIGNEASFNIHVSFEGQPYPADEISTVKFLVFDSAGALVYTGEATREAEGRYKAVVPANVTGGLAAGSNKIEVAVSSLVVALPSFDSFEFVTAQ